MFMRITWNDFMGLSIFKFYTYVNRIFKYIEEILLMVKYQQNWTEKSKGNFFGLFFS